MKKNSSWEEASKWYDTAVGEKGLYYHTKIIFPALLRLLNFSQNSKSSLLDLACGQGVLARHLPSTVSYLGIDGSPSLIRSAQMREKGENRNFITADLSQPLLLKNRSFTHAVILLALQNIAQPQVVLQSAAHHLQKGGTLLLVLNHPCFRIPRQSSWIYDEGKKMECRKIDRYMTPLSIPIQTRPGASPAEAVVSFHYPLSSLFQWLHEAGFSVTGLEEWCSDKESQGARRGAENRARKEFPLFLTLRCERL